jgi:alkylhydroperoxidase family enzyme
LFMADDAAGLPPAEAPDAPARADRQGSEWAPTERISWFPVPDEAELDPRVAELVARQRQKLGAPNNVVRVHAWRPELLLRWLELQDYITKGPSALSRVEREMIAVVVSAANRCLF